MGWDVPTGVSGGEAREAAEGEEPDEELLPDDDAAAHCAYSVTADDVVMLAPFEYAVPDPSAAEFQPLKLRPERLKLFVLIAVAMPEFTV